MVSVMIVNRQGETEEQKGQRFQGREDPGCCKYTARKSAERVAPCQPAAPLATPPRGSRPPDAF